MADDLRSFYMPIAMRLEMDSVYTCGQVAELYARESEAVRRGFIEGAVFPNHTAIRETIEKRGDLLAADTALRSAALAFIHHANLYRTLADAETVMGTPDALGVPWPKALLPVLRDRAGELERRRQKCSADQGSCTAPIDWLRRPGGDSLQKLAGTCRPALSITGRPRSGPTKR